MYFTQITAPLTNSALPCFISQREGVARRARSRPLFHPESADATAARRWLLGCADSRRRRLSDGGRVCARVQRVKRLGAVSEGQPALHYAA